MSTEDSTKDIIFGGFLALQKMKGVPVNVKHRMLTNLMAMNKNSWKVVGITQAALKKFVDNNFNRPKGVNRSHIHQRSETTKYLFSRTDWDRDCWWDYYTKRDITILATSSENMDKKEDVSKFDVPVGLFKTRGFAFTVKDAEKKFLKEISKKCNWERFPGG